MIRSQLNKLLSKLNSKIIWAFISQGIIAILSIIFAKLLALNISPDDFGIYNLQFAVLSFANSLFINPVLQSFKSNWNLRHSSEVLSYHGNIITAIHLLAIAAGIMSYFFVSFPAFLFIIFLNLYWICQTFFTLERDFLNIVDNQKNYAILAFLAAFLPVLAILLLINTNLPGPWKIWIAQISSFLIPLLIINLLYTQKNISFKIGISSLFKNVGDYKSIHSTLLTFTTPLVVLAVFSWFSNYSDKYFIKHYLDNHQVGLYSAAYGLASKFILTLNAPFVLLLNPIVLNFKNNNNPERHLDINASILKYVKTYAIAGIICIVVLYYLKDVLGLLFLSDKYQDCFSLLPYLAISYLFLTICHLMETKFYAFGRTKFVLYHNIAAAIMNVILNVLLIPELGIMGSAIAMLMTTFTQLLFCFYLIRRI